MLYAAYVLIFCLKVTILSPTLPIFAGLNETPFLRKSSMNSPGVGSARDRIFPKFGYVVGVFIAALNFEMVKSCLLTAAVHDGSLKSSGRLSGIIVS